MAATGGDGLLTREAQVVRDLPRGSPQPVPVNCLGQGGKSQEREHHEEGDDRQQLGDRETEG
jgi:hypothetical protein